MNDAWIKVTDRLPEPHIDILWYDGGGDDWLGLGGLQWTGKEGWGRRPKEQKYKHKKMSCFFI